MNKMVANQVWVAGVEPAARVAGELLAAHVEQVVDVERPAQRLPGRAVDAVRGVDRLEHEAVALAQPLVRRFERLLEVGELAVPAADAVEVDHGQSSWPLPLQPLTPARAGIASVAEKWPDGSRRAALGPGADGAPAAGAVPGHQPGHPRCAGVVRHGGRPGCPPKQTLAPPSAPALLRSLPGPRPQPRPAHPCGTGSPDHPSPKVVPRPNPPGRQHPRPSLHIPGSAVPLPRWGCPLRRTGAPAPGGQDRLTGSG